VLKEKILYEETPAARPGSNAVNAPPRSEADAKQDWSGPHPVDIRLTLPLFFSRYYLTVLAGRERRSSDRLRADRRLHPLLKVGNVALFLVFGSVVGLALLSVIQLLAYWVLL
jgi:hypothetical protein